MAKAKAKTVKVKIGIKFDGKGHCELEGDWDGGKKPTDDDIVTTLRGWSLEPYPYIAIVDIELEVPQQPKGKVLKIKKVK